MLVFGNPACHLRPIRARQVFLPEVIIKRCGEDEDGAGRNRVGDEKRERERKRRGGGGGGGLQVSSRAYFPDSKGDFHIMILQQSIAYFKGLITTPF